jgi:methionyl-tRNA formyltransferase
MTPRVVFMGTAEFAVPAMQALHHQFGLLAVVTLPDAPRGRGQVCTPTPVGAAAEALGIPTILKPTSLRDPDFVAAIAALQPDVICVIAFRILPRSVYALAGLGTFNVHASLLPRHRGAAPINHAILAGDTRTGVTSFLLNDVVDTGTILLQRGIDIPDGMTAGELYEALMPMAAECAVATTRGLINGSLVPMPQDDSLATPAPKVFREQCRIRWNQPRSVVRNFIHGMSPTPCAWSVFHGDTIKVYRAAFADAPLSAGQVQITDDAWVVGCMDGSLALTEIQLPNKKRLPVGDVLRGYRGARKGVME